MSLYILTHLSLCSLLSNKKGSILFFTKSLQQQSYGGFPVLVNDVSLAHTQNIAHTLCTTGIAAQRHIQAFKQPRQCSSLVWDASRDMQVQRSSSSGLPLEMDVLMAVSGSSRVDFFSRMIHLFQSDEDSVAAQESDKIHGATLLPINLLIGVNLRRGKINKCRNAMVFIMMSNDCNRTRERKMQHLELDNHSDAFISFQSAVK